MTADHNPGLPAHALFSASGAEGWMNCAPKLSVERGVRDESSEYADEGTAAHTLASWCLEEKMAALAYKGRRIDVGHRTFEVTADMAGHVQRYVDAIYERMEQFKLRGAMSVELLVEIRVDYSRFLKVPDSFGTSDVVLLIEWPDGTGQVDVNDLKYGMGIAVFASQLAGNGAQDENGDDVREGNKQMMLYALGAYDQFSPLLDARLFSMAIHQPRIHHFDEFECDWDTLMAFANQAREAAENALMYYESSTPALLSNFTPGEKQCRWCKVGGSCKARAAKNLATMAGDFVDLDEHNNVGDAANAIKDVVVDAGQVIKLDDAGQLDALWPSLDEIEAWIKSVRGEIEKRALSGAKFVNCKLVLGKKGNRAFTNKEEAERVMKGMRLKQDEMYTYNLITPTAAELLLKDQPKRWAKLTPLIGQSDGKLSVADRSDKRAEVQVTPPADDFEVLNDGEEFA